VKLMSCGAFGAAVLRLALVKLWRRPSIARF